MYYAIKELTGKKLELENHIDKLEEVEKETSNEEISYLIGDARANLEDVSYAIEMLEEAHKNTTYPL